MAQGDHRGSLTASVNSVTNPTNLSGSVASVAVGDLIFGVFAQQTNLTAGGTVTDNLGNTYAYVNAGTDAGNATIRCFWSRVTTGGTLTQISVPATASTNDASAVGSVIEGPFLTSPLDANPANTTDGTSPHACPPTGTLAQANEVVMAACSLASNIAMTATSPGVITQTVARANVSCAVQRRTVASTTTVTPEFGNGATANAAQTTASFKLATVHVGSTLFTGTGTLGTTAIKYKGRATLFAAAGSLTTRATSIFRRLTACAASGSMATTATKFKGRTSTFGAVGTLATTATKFKGRTTTFSAVGSMASVATIGSGGTTHERSTAFAAAGLMASSAIIVKSRSTAFSAIGTMTSACTATYRRTTLFSAFGLVSMNATRIVAQAAVVRADRSLGGDYGLRNSRARIRFGTNLRSR